MQNKKLMSFQYLFIIVWVWIASFVSMAGSVDDHGTKTKVLERISQVESTLNRLSNEIIQFNTDYNIPDVIPRERDRKLFAEDITKLRDQYILSPRHGVMAAIKEIKELTKQIIEQPNPGTVVAQVYVDGFLIASNYSNDIPKKDLELREMCARLETRLKELIVPKGAEEVLFGCGVFRTYYTQNSIYDRGLMCSPRYSYKIRIPAIRKLKIKTFGTGLNIDGITTGFYSALTNEPYGGIPRCLEELEKVKQQIGDSFVAGDCGKLRLDFSSDTSYSIRSDGYRLWYLE